MWNEINEYNNVNFFIIDNYLVMLEQSDQI